MAKAGWRSRIPALFLVLGIACTQRAAASDEDIPPLRTKEKVNSLVWLTSPIVDFELPPISSIPRNHPFKAIGLKVRGAPAADELAKFARRAMQARLEELGVAEQIHVIHPPNPGTDGQPPAGFSPCDVLRVTFVFNGAPQVTEVQGVIAIAADMLATQQASDCAIINHRSAWALQAGPRAAVVPSQDEQATLEHSQKLILRFIDADLVLKVLSSNHTAAETLRSWAKEIN